MKSKLSVFLDSCAMKMPRSAGTFYQRRIKAAAALDKMRDFYTQQLEEINRIAPKVTSVTRSWEKEEEVHAHTGMLLLAQEAVCD